MWPFVSSEEFISDPASLDNSQCLRAPVYPADVQIMDIRAKTSSSVHIVLANIHINTYLHMNADKINC